MELRPYQQEISTKAADLLIKYKIAYLSMQVRTGKTITAFNAAFLFGAKNILFVTKKKAISSIVDDAFHFIFNAVQVINYEQIHNCTFDADLVILDEAHCLGQYPIPAERTKKLQAYCKGKPIIYLSGTPTPESYSQLYHQLFVSSFTPFGYYTNFYKWAKDFVTIRKKYMYNREFNDYSLANKEKIDELTRHLFISYTQEEAGFNQVVQDVVIKVKMQDSTYYLVKKLLADKVFIGKAGNEIVADTAVKMMNKLHQIYSGTVIDEAGEGIVFDYTKAKHIKEKYAGKKIAIFYKFKAEYAALLAVFGFERLTDSPDVFNQSSDKIFVSQIQSGREGVNLSTADYLIMYNIDFSSVSYQQARNRMQHKDRQQKAEVHWLFADGGIEEKIYEKVLNKQDYTLSYFRKEYGIKDTVQNKI